LVLPVLASIVLLAAQAPAPEPAREFDRLVASAVELHQAGDVLGAIDGYSAALRLEPNHAGVRSNLGAAYVRLGKFDEAIEQYREALRIDPGNPAAGFNLGLAYYKAARLTDAIAGSRPWSAPLRATGQPCCFSPTRCCRVAGSRT
jgi:Flp pilus assembly protein TadD